MNREKSNAGAVLFLTLDADIAVTLRDALAAWSIRVESHADPSDAIVRFPTDPPALLLLDSRLVSAPDEIGLLVARIADSFPAPIPLVVLAHTQDIRFRLAAMRAGAEVYLPVPRNAEELVDRLALLIGIRRQAPERVLVVDDQSVAALFASRVLQGAGMVAERVCNPLEVMGALERFSPDLLLMDLHMPGVSGIELTGVIREDDRFADLPIIFLSAELDPEQQMAALRIGGDDFLAKPVAPDQLVSCVRQRLQRVRELARRYRGPEATDRQTGLATRECLLLRLDRLIGQASPSQPGSRRADEDQRPAGRRAVVYLELQGTDEAMERLAAEVASRIEEGDLAARVGERAVAVLIRRSSHLSLAEFSQALTYHVGRALAETMVGTELGGGWYPLTGGCTDSVTLLSRAGKAARLALGRGDRRVGKYDREDSGAGSDQHESAVLDAIRSGRLQLLFEPMVALADIAGARYELKPRLLMKDGELLLPVDFVPIAARRGAAGQLDRWLLSAGLDLMKERLVVGQPVQLYIHQSLASVGEGDWMTWVRDEINARDLIRLRPVLQFQIEDVERNLELAVSLASQLGRLGIRICLNGVDFGERSARVLNAISWTFARIGRRLVQEPDGQSITWLIQSAKASGSKVIATGVDGPERIARLFAAGADLIQGPYVQPPTTEMEFDFAGAEVSDPMG